MSTSACENTGSSKTPGTRQSWHQSNHTLRRVKSISLDFPDSLGTPRKLVRMLIGFRSSYLRLVDDKVSVIVLANGGAALPGVMAIKVARHYVPQLAPEQAASANRRRATRSGRARK